MGDLRNKTALVTGAAGIRGMGRAIAMRLAAEGANVAVLDHPNASKSFTPEAREAGWLGLDSVVKEIELSGRQALALNCDITSSSSVQSVVDVTLQKFGQIDILVNNAAVGGPVDVHLADMDDQTWSTIIQVNLTGAFFVSRSVAKSMIKRGEGGKIINIASWVGKTGLAGMGAYGAAKAGMLNLTQTMALELARDNIRVNAICPGGIPTDITYDNVKKLAAEKNISIAEARMLNIESLRSRLPIRQSGDVADIANAVAFLASDQSNYITGQSLNVDGGGLMAR